MTDASAVIPSTQQQQIAQTLEDDAQVVSNTQLDKLLAERATGRPRGDPRHQHRRDEPRPAGGAARADPRRPARVVRLVAHDPPAGHRALDRRRSSGPGLTELPEPDRASGMSEERSTPRLERWVPGVRVARTYDRSWLRSDLVAGIVLAAILVPQGMAYAELAGLPAVTGPLHDDRLPRRLRGVRPVAGAGARARLVGLAADPRRDHAAARCRRRPRRPRSRSPACSPCSSGLIEIGLGLGKLGFVADLLSSEVQVGYMNGLAITIIVGQLPKLFGFSTDADSFLDEVEQFVEQPRRDRRDDAARGRRRARRAARAPAGDDPDAGHPRRGGRRHRRLRGPRTSPTTASRPSGRCRRASRRRRCRGRAPATSCRC